MRKSSSTNRRRSRRSNRRSVEVHAATHVVACVKVEGEDETLVALTTVSGREAAARAVAITISVPRLFRRLCINFPILGVVLATTHNSRRGIGRPFRSFQHLRQTFENGSFVQSRLRA